MVNWDAVNAIGTWAGSILVLVVGVLAAFIARGQNSINKKALGLSNFVELYITPENVQVNETKWDSRLLIRNASSHPIYLRNYRINGTKVSVGSFALPQQIDYGYRIVLTDDMEKLGNLSLEIEFEDYLGEIYKSTHYAECNNHNWLILRGEKRVRFQVEH